MGEAPRVQGELQAEIMTVLWRIGAGTVEQVRSGLPEGSAGAYTTIQTVLNRLAERGLLTRERERNTIVYRPAMSEADYVGGALTATLDSASSSARRLALARLVDRMDPAEVEELRALAQQAREERGTP
ncbi:BlaI/MecI/CopY family transcriptional regulator [Yinghuangia soli]|uniref:BlaI/MecI/CopY family transcriptional regulator n=1 Tax=Yinghuangia soli TaxID=2908204 RepID=A0AA41Q809_9ACTN|nr:BlaI/MecI/CopY family transcriptional regulator [Yinghuangia soli]MCF2533298.1 BlaI/MecI/CopY family transcriptional regulator [Yinghuangia soli]